MKVEEFRTEFNRQAESMNLDGRFRIDEIETKGGALSDSFTYNFTQELVLMGTINKESGDVDSLTVIANGGTLRAATDLMLLPVVVIATVAPSIEKERRGKAVFDLYTQALETSGKSHSADVGGLHLSAGAYDSMGAIMFFIGPKEANE